MINQDKINKALLFASVNHEGQKMKQPDVSYVAHLQGVCLEAVSGCLNFNLNVDLEKVILLALLHDTIEDTNVSYSDISDNFDEDIADGVLALTKNDELKYDEKMIDSLNRIKKQSVEVAIVKLADRIFNMKDIPSFWDDYKVELYKEEAKLILKELGYANGYMARRLEEKILNYKR